MHPYICDCNFNYKVLSKFNVFRPKRTDKRGGGDMLDMVRKFLSGRGLDDALSLFGLVGKDESGLPT